jgi:hypothetical protein
MYKKQSQKQEKSVAKKLNAKVTIASGALWGMKGDVRNDKYLIECKTTSKSYYSLTAKVWEKIEKEAIKDHGRIPLMVIDLLNGDNRYVVFNPNDFEGAGSKKVAMPLKEVNKSFRISYDLLGYDMFDNYTSSVTFFIKETKLNKLCIMLMEDFDRFLEVNKCH